VIHNVQQGGKAAVVIKAAFGMCPQAVERSCAITVVRRTAGLKIVNTDIRSQMHVPSRLGHQRLNMAASTLTFAVEKFLTARGGRAIKTTLRRRWSRKRELIEMQSRELGRDLVIGIGYVSETIFGGNGEFRSIV